MSRILQWSRSVREIDARCEGYTPGMEWLLEAGPFSAKDGEGRVLFADAAVRLPEAAAVVLDGPSGGGKSTLLRHVTALIDGSVGPSGDAAARMLNGESFKSDTLPLWRSRVTLVAQDAPMLPGSVRHNLEFPYRFGVAASRTYDDDRARSLMKDVGLEVPVDRNVLTLSGGERHRLALVRGLLWDPPVLVADEPLSGLDADVASTCVDLMLQFAHRPAHALLVVLHHRELGERADARIHLKNGRLEVT